MTAVGLQRRVDAVAATAPQRLLLAGLTLVIVGVCSALLAASSARTDGFLAFVVIAAAVGALIQPDDHLGLVVIGLLVIQWVTSEEPTTSAWTLAVATVMLVFHTILALFAATPSSSTIPLNVLAVWGRRVVAVMAPTAAAWLLVVGLERRDAPGNLALSVVAFVGLAIGVLGLHHGLRDQ